MAETYSFQVSALPREGEGLFTLINTTDDENFELLELFADITHGGAAYNQFSCHSKVEKISAASGGVAVAFTGARSNAASLSGKITLAVLPSSVTYAALLRNVEACYLMQPYSTATITGQFYQQTSMGPLCRRNMSGLMFSGSGEVQSFILAAGEGVAYSNNAEQSAATAVSTLVRRRRRYTVRITVSGDSYVADFYVPTPLGGRPLFSVFNESGSGVSCTINAIETELVSEEADFINIIPTYGGIGNPGFSLQYVDSIFGYGNLGVRDSITFNPFRTNAASLSGKLLSYVGDAAGGMFPEARHAGNQLRLGQANDFPYFTSANTFRAFENRASLAVVKPRPLSSSVQNGWVVGMRQPLVEKNRCPVVIKPKEGISLIATGMPAMGVDVTIFGVINRVPPNATYPAVGDVDNGVQYGPTGTDYTGTLVQPAEADVENGVSYGAGGTEFTGTFVGGGGGNTYSRGRVVNS